MILPIFSQRQKIQIGVITTFVVVCLIGGGYLLYNHDRRPLADYIPPSQPAVHNTTQIMLHIVEGGQPALGTVNFQGATCTGSTDGTVGGADGYFYCTSTSAIQFKNITYTSYNSQNADNEQGVTYTIVPQSENPDASITVPSSSQLILNAVLDGNGTDTQPYREVSLNKWVNGAFVDTQDGTALQE